MKQNMGRIVRYLLILYKLKGPKKYVETRELIDYLENQMANRGFHAGISQRTIQRDKDDILDIFGVEINHRKGEGYYISNLYEGAPAKYEELLMDFDLLTALDPETHARGYIIPEHHRPVGSDNIPELIEAIKQRSEIRFEYTLLRKGDALVYPVVRPYFIKQSLGLWYLVGMDGDNKLKTYGIDRISRLQVLNTTFRRDEGVDADSLFKDCFGIWDDPATPVEEIELSYSALDGKFLKRNPLHRSQKVLVDTEEEFRIQLNLKITNDFVMALLSRSNSLTVVRPLSLRERVRDVYLRALERHR